MRWRRNHLEHLCADIFKAIEEGGGVEDEIQENLSFENMIT